jgi:hypothetical protein
MQRQKAEGKPTGWSSKEKAETAKDKHIQPLF